VALGQVYLRVPQFPPCQCHSTMLLHTHITWGMNNRLVGAAVQRYSLSNRFVGSLISVFQQEDYMSGVAN
jgi:hypothetical protein